MHQPGPQKDEATDSGSIATESGSIATVCSAQSSALQAPSERALRIPCYCEENVWRLAYRRLSGERYAGKHYVVFISNKMQCVPMFYQLAKDNPHQPCVWDYHVILLWTTSTKTSQHETPTAPETTNGNRKDRRTVVLDMDSHLQYPCPLDEYLINTFPLDYTGGQEKLAPTFRVLEAAQFLQSFCSDRMHMYNAETREWSAPPPDYNCIQTNEGLSSNLHDYINMSQTKEEASTTGRVLSLVELQTEFCDS